MKLNDRDLKRPNFGDDLNNWLWPKLIPECLEEDDGIDFLGIGTLLSNKRFSQKLRNSEKVVIFSSGCWGVDVPTVDSRWHIYGVRGPRTAAHLKISDSKVIGDGAYLLSGLPLPSTSSASKIAFIPHHRSEQYVDWPKVCELAGLKFISATQDVDSFLLDVSQCKKVVAEAMHGAIAADIFRIPWIPTSFAPNFNNEKWLDWVESMDMQIEFSQLPMTYQRKLSLLKSVENFAKKRMRRIQLGPEKWERLPDSLFQTSNRAPNDLVHKLNQLADKPGHMSSDVALQRTFERLSTSLEKLRRDYKTGKI